MRIDILTLFPNMFNGLLSESILKHAVAKELITINISNIRDCTSDKHKTADDRPYGGGPGMVMKIDPVYQSLQKLGLKIRKKVHRSCLLDIDRSKTRVILMSPQGEMFTQKKALSLSKYKRLIFICGHYEGIDERVRKHLCTDTISIGDYVLTGGEIPAAVVIDAVARMIPGVVGKQESLKGDSFYNEIFDWPHYTRPQEFKGLKVPQILLSGNHKKIIQWRKKEALKNTLKLRPDLVKDKNSRS
jgi:tRNA (guanine37-N1)-methyltransferase